MTIPAHALLRAVRTRAAAALTATGLAASLLAAPQLTGAAAAVPSPATGRQWAFSMLAALNGERRAHHLAPLSMNWRLVRSAHGHDVAMARRNVMSHQLPGEAFFATRISRTGYRWRSAGENIGWNSAQSRPGLLALERFMYNEKAPNDGHRRNILNRNFRQVGIDVYFDARHHKMWFTQDFGQPA